MLQIFTFVGTMFLGVAILFISIMFVKDIWYLTCIVLSIIIILLSSFGVFKSILEYTGW